MNKLEKTFLYFRHISFIIYLCSMIILLPCFYKFDIGIICLIISMIYIIFTFAMMFIKNKNEESSVFNNFVLSFLHIYILIIAYRYTQLADSAITDNFVYFKINFFIITLCMFILTINKIILSNSK